jgi:hypothetical protein
MAGGGGGDPPGSPRRIQLEQGDLPGGPGAPPGSIMFVQKRERAIKDLI